MAAQEDGPIEKPTEWIASSRDDMREMPEEVQDVFGFALYLAQIGEKHPDAKPMKGYKGSAVIEIVEDFDGDTYRAVYTARLAGVIYVLHVFQKKSKKGIATPKTDLDLIKGRYALAEAHHDAHYRVKKQTG